MSTVFLCSNIQNSKRYAINDYSSGVSTRMTVNLKMSACKYLLYPILNGRPFSESGFPLFLTLLALSVLTYIPQYSLVSKTIAL